MFLLILWDTRVTNDPDYVPFVVIIIWSFPYWRLITGCVTRVTRQVAQSVPALLIFPEHMSLSPGFARSVGFYIVFSHHLLAIVLLVLLLTTSDFHVGVFWSLYYSFFFWRLLITTLESFGHCIDSSSVDGFWLSRWCLQTFLTMSYLVVFMVIIRFVNIAQSVEHHWLRFPFIA